MQVDAILAQATNQAAISEQLQKFGLDWEVEMIPLSTPEGYVTDHYALRRRDNQKIFGYFSDSYHPVQNSYALELIQKVSQVSEIPIIAGGYFKGGARTYIQLDGDEFEFLDGDKLKNRLTIINSHDGSKAFAMGLTNVTISCQNTFHKAYRELSKVCHFHKVEDKVDKLVRSLITLKSKELELVQTFEKMADKKVNPQIMRKLMLGLTGVDLSISKTEWEQNYKKSTIKQTLELLESIDHETKAKGHSRWGLFSGVTFYTNHRMRRGKNMSNEQAIFMGNAGDLNQKAFQILEVE